MSITKNLFENSEFKDHFLNKSQEKRIIKIELNPYKKSTVKFKMKTPRLSNFGKPFARKVDDKYQLETSLEEVPNLLRTPGTSKLISPIVTAEGLKTGLDIMVSNPYYSEKNDKNKHKFKFEWAERVLSDPKVKLQHLLEYKHDRDFDYYTNKISTEPIPNSKPDKKYFEKPESRLRLSNNTTILDLDNPQHELHYYLILVHPAVANSLLECEEGSQADWYIVDEKERVKKKLDKTEKIVKFGYAITKLKDSADSNYDLTCMAKALDISQASNPKLTNEDLILMIQEYVGVFETTRTELSVEHSFNNFIKYFEWYEDPARRNYFEAAALVFDLIQYRILDTSKNRYKVVMPDWKHDGSYIEYERSNKNEFITDFLCDNRYSTEVSLLKEMLNKKQN